MKERHLLRTWLALALTGLTSLCSAALYAQEKFARTDSNAAIVRATRYYKYSDTWHYDSEGYLDLGLRFAESLYEISNKQ